MRKDIELNLPDGYNTMIYTCIKYFVIFFFCETMNSTKVYVLSGGLAVAVPGELMGYWEAHRKYGNLPWSELFQPAIALCNVGSYVNDYLAAYLHVKEPMIRNESSLVEILINPVTNKTWIVSEQFSFILLHLFYYLISKTCDLSEG